MRILTVFVFLMLSCIPNLHGQSLEVISPNGVISLTFTLDGGRPIYQVERFGNQVIKSSQLGLMLNNNIDFTQGFNILSVERNSIDEWWTQVWGEKKEIRNHCQELVVHLNKPDFPHQKMVLVFRVFNDGVGFRYLIPKQKSIKQFEIVNEVTEFVLPENHRAWWIPAYEGNRYEFLYRNTTVTEMPKVHTPVTFESSDGLFLSIHEAALVDYASMTLAPQSDYTLKADLVPWADGVLVKGQAPMKTPWRTVQIAENAGELITSYLTLNLNEPNRLEETGWIQPGKYVGIWWEMHLGVSTWGSGDTHGATTANTKRYLDFAGKYGFDGVLVEGWNLGWDGDWYQNRNDFSFTTPYADYDISALHRYAKDKGVRLIGHHETATGVLNYEKQLGSAYKYAKKHGMRAVKTGYVGHGQCVDHPNDQGDTVKEWHHGQFMVRHYQRTVEEAAKHQIMLDIHEPIKDTGLRRTWPNLMTREGARGQEYNAWGPNGGNPPDHTTILPFTRMLSGPFDFTPGIFDLLFDEAKPNNRVNTTLMKQLALYVVIYSPLQMAADLPVNYESRRDAFQFIIDVPADWADTQVLHARIGDYVTIVRKDRHAEDWYLGSVTDENGRLLNTSLHFLDRNRKYVAQIYRDGDRADWKTRPYDYVIEERLVDSATVLQIRLAPGGGQAIRFYPATDDEIMRLGFFE